MTSTDIRQKFFTFFADRSHQIVPSSSLIPAQDPTILFTNAGMNQFKDLFLGLEQRSYDKAVSIQKCVRAGGKHNDLDNVGFTARHLTFFEMMGNFSFGDYFKKKAIEYAWEFLTQTVKIVPENLHVTVHQTDDESYEIWKTEIGVSQTRLHRLGDKENFWQMADLGPCGPCTEIHLDRGPSYGCPNIDVCGPACDCDRFLEIWNLVFMQYDRQPNGSLIPLGQTGVDTGMGLERLCAVLQHVDSVYETDLFTPIIHAIEQTIGRTYTQETDSNKAAYHVVADHIRSSSLLISDGCTPSNEGRGYVLRKIIRRAALFAQKLTSGSQAAHITPENLFTQAVNSVVNLLGPIYPNLIDTQVRIQDVLKSEVEKFAINLSRGQQLFNRYIQQIHSSKIVPGATAFKLYDTYGFPLELITVMAHENGWTVDVSEFNACMEKQQAQSGKKTVDALDYVAIDESIHTEFTGYQELETTSYISALVIGHELVEMVPPDTQCWVIAARSPFFIVGGGQVPDEGWITIDQFKTKVQQLRYINGRIAALIEAPTTLTASMKLTSTVDDQTRNNAMKNHTATHLLQAALQLTLSDDVKQAGSLVHPDYLRFDFLYHTNLTPEQIRRIEFVVNEKIQQNVRVNIEYGSLKEAQEKGALAFFGEKYNPEQVRMVIVPDFSTELCGGTHVQHTGEIGVFKITEVSSPSATTRRIVAITGPKAVELFQKQSEIIKLLVNEYKVPQNDLLPTIIKNKETLKDLRGQVAQLKRSCWDIMAPEWKQNILNVDGIPFLFLSIPDANAHDLRGIATQLTQDQPGFYVISGSDGHQQAYIATLSAQCTQKISLKQFSTWLKTQHEISGGGSEKSFQGSSQKPIDAHMLKESIIEWIKKESHPSS